MATNWQFLPCCDQKALNPHIFVILGFCTDRVIMLGIWMLLHRPIFTPQEFPQILLLREKMGNLLEKNLIFGVGKKEVEMTDVFMSFLLFLSGIVIFPKHT